jgi:putative SOS response-associated peptidase YedK
MVDLHGLLVPAPNELLTMHPVATEVNKVSNKTPDLIVEIDSSTPSEGETPSLFG